MCVGPFMAYEGMRRPPRKHFAAASKSEAIRQLYGRRKCGR